MNGRVPITLLCSAALAFACGPRARNETASNRGEPTRVVRVVDPSSPLTPSLDVTVNDEVRFAFEITNDGKKKLELNFADGRTHDLVAKEKFQLISYSEFIDKEKYLVNAFRQTICIFEKETELKDRFIFN